MRISLAIFVVCIVAIAFLILSSPLAPPLSDLEVRDIVQTEIGPIDIQNITFENPCTCIDPDCSSVCWNITGVKDNQNITIFVTPGKDVVLASGGGGSGGGGGENSDSPAPPIIYECNVTTVDSSSDPTITRTNTGCSNPTPTCDSDDRTCRRCFSPEDCVRTSDYQYSTGEHILSYQLIGTSFSGNYTALDSRCLLSDNVIVIADNITTIDECTNIVQTHSTCTDQGVCKFI